MQEEAEDEEVHIPGDLYVDVRGPEPYGSVIINVAQEGENAEDRISSLLLLDAKENPPVVSINLQVRSRLVNDTSPAGQTCLLFLVCSLDELETAVHQMRVISKRVGPIV